MKHPCDVCGSSKAVEVPHVREYTNGQVIHICENCGFVYVEERRSAKEIADAWTKEMYGKQYNPGTPLMVARHNYIAEFIHQSIDLHDKTVCDVGAGNGQFLEIVKRYYAYTFGIEPSESNCYAMANKNIPFFNGTIEDFPVEEIRFDTIALLWTLENTSSPNVMLKRCREIVKDDGYLVVATGSRLLVPFAKPLDLYLSRNSVDTHPSRFSINTLTTMLYKHGFRVDFINKYLNDSLTLCVIAKKVEIPDQINLPCDNYKEVWEHFDTWHHLSKQWKGEGNV